MKSLLFLALALSLHAAPGPNGGALFDGSGAAAPLSFPAPPESAKPADPEKKEEAKPNVILITWDGVRPREIFSNKPDPALEKTDTAPLLPYFWTTLVPQGVLYGDEKSSNIITIANLAVVSLPAYQSIMAGRMTSCMNNDCPRIAYETFEERLVRELGLPKGDVATIPSWEKIPLAVEHVASATYTDPAPYTRADSDTWTRAMAYLKDKKPRFLYISLNDSDEHGHANRYDKYVADLRQYDSWLKDLFAILAGLGGYGAQTTVIVTTDHGRGVGADWVNHGGRSQTASKVWLYAKGPGTAHAGVMGQSASPHSHLDIRPTIETIFGLAPASGNGLGSALPEVAAPPAVAGVSGGGSKVPASSNP